MLKEEIKNIAETEKDLRKFGLSVGGVFTLLAVLLFFHGNKIAYISGIAGLSLIIAAFFHPSILKPINKVWMIFSILSGWFMTRVILIILFYIVLLPTSVLAKIFNKKFLELNIDKSGNTYWKKREKKPYLPKDYENQF